MGDISKTNHKDILCLIANLCVRVFSCLVFKKMRHNDIRCLIANFVCVFSIVFSIYKQ